MTGLLFSRPVFFLERRFISTFIAKTRHKERLQDHGTNNFYLAARTSELRYKPCLRGIPCCQVFEGQGFEGRQIEEYFRKKRFTFQKKCVRNAVTQKNSSHSPEKLIRAMSLIFRWSEDFRILCILLFTHVSIDSDDVYIARNKRRGTYHVKTIP